MNKSRYLCEPPFKDELISSWIARNALLFGMKPRVLSTLVFEDTDVWKSDIDVYVSPQNIALLSKNMTVNAQLIKNSTLYANCHHFYNQTEETTQVKWVMPIGIRTNNKNYGLQYCPCCLNEDADRPYFRRYWRLGFLTCCVDHSVQLHDRCPECNQPIDIKRLKKPENKILYSPDDLVHCAQCGFDLRKTKYVVVEPNEYKINRINYLQARLGYGQMGNLEFSYSNLYFEGIRRLMSFLVCSPKGEKLFMHLRKKLDLFQIYHREFIGHNVEPERLDISLRRTGLLMVLHLLQDWPESFVDACKDSGITSHLIKTPYLEFPFWVTDALFFKIRENKYLACPDEKSSIIKYFKKCLKKSINEKQAARFVKYYFGR